MGCCKKSMKTIQILDKKFSLFISEADILHSVKQIADKINLDLSGKEPIFLCMLNGAFMFVADLLKNVNIPCEIAFVRFSSYEGTNSTGDVKQIIGLTKEIKNRTVVIVEDIVDSGLTMQYMLKVLREKQPKEIKVASMFVKPENIQVDNLHLDYVGMNIPNDFIVGYGLDYNEYGRNLKEIYKIVE